MQGASPFLKKKEEEWMQGEEGRLGMGLGGEEVGRENVIGWQKIK